MLNLIIIICAIVLLGGLLCFEKKENHRGVLPVKTILSLLFIVAALVQPNLIQSYAIFVIIGLIFCLGGDVFLALPQERMFLLGLVSFLIGHVFYVVAFIGVAGWSQLAWIGPLLTIVISIAVFIWLQPHLGSMKIPVICYIIVISLMLCLAWSILGVSHLSVSGRILVFLGAFSFYISDVFVARDRFLKNEFLNRLVGLPLYYMGQFLIAFSVGALTYQ
jgi:uncharacterized membrane protein YhhN